MSEMKQGDLVTVLTPHGEFVGRLEKMMTLVFI